MLALPLLGVLVLDTISWFSAIKDSFNCTHHLPNAHKTPISHAKIFLMRSVFVHLQMLLFFFFCLFLFSMKFTVVTRLFINVSASVSLCLCLSLSVCLCGCSGGSGALGGSLWKPRCLWRFKTCEGRWANQDWWELKQRHRPGKAHSPVMFLLSALQHELKHPAWLGCWLTHSQRGHLG